PRTVRPDEKEVVARVPPHSPCLLAADTCGSGDVFVFRAESAPSAVVHIAVIVVLAVVLRYVVHRVIKRLIRHTASGLPLPLRRLRRPARELLDVTGDA